MVKKKFSKVGAKTTFIVLLILKRKKYKPFLIKNEKEWFHE